VFFELKREKKMKLQTLVEVLAKNLQDDIIEGRYSPGDELNIDEIARTLNVSKTPIREALAQLSQIGLVTYRPRIGWSVSQLSAEEFDELIEIQYALRKFVNETLEPYLGAIDFGKLEVLNAQMHEDLAARRFRSLFESNDAFHQAIYSVYPNKELLRRLDELSSMVRLQRIHMLEKNLLDPDSNLFKAAPREHDEIIAALRSRDMARIIDTSNRHQRTILSVLTDPQD
jgi:DNA-binding GntR family transcriptional regulator